MRVGEYLRVTADMGRRSYCYGFRTIYPASGQYLSFRSNSKFGWPCNSVLSTDPNVALNIAPVTEYDAHPSRKVKPGMQPHVASNGHSAADPEDSPAQANNGSIIGAGPRQIGKLENQPGD